MIARSVSSGAAPLMGVVGALALLTLVTAGLAAVSEAGVLVDGFSRFHWPDAVAVALLYLGAHLLRILRMLVLLGDSIGSVRAVAFAHAATAPVSALVPFKVGEIARVYAFGRASDGFLHGLRTVWIERTFDAAVIAAAGVAALATLDQTAGLLPVTIAAFSVLVLTGVAITVLPENVGMVKAWLIRRYSTGWSIRALAFLHDLGMALRESRGLVQGKVATLATLTFALWGMELAALYFLMPVAADELQALVAGLLAVLSDVFLPVAREVFSDGLPVHRLVVFGTVNGFALLAFVGLAIDRSRLARRDR